MGKASRFEDGRRVIGPFFDYRPRVANRPVHTAGLHRQACCSGTEIQGQPDPLSRGLCAQLSVQESSRTWFSQTGSQETKEAGNTNPGRICCRSGAADRAFGLGSTPEARI